MTANYHHRRPRGHRHHEYLINRDKWAVVVVIVDPSTSAATDDGLNARAPIVGRQRSDCVRGQRGPLPSVGQRLRTDEAPGGPAANHLQLRKRLPQPGHLGETHAGHSSGKHKPRKFLRHLQKSKIRYMSSIHFLLVVIPSLCLLPLLILLILLSDKQVKVQGNFN